MGQDNIRPVRDDTLPHISNRRVLERECPALRGQWGSKNGYAATADRESLGVVVQKCDIAPFQLITAADILGSNALGVNRTSLSTSIKVPGVVSWYTRLHGPMLSAAN